jgi:hypothetical protein
MKAIHEWRRVDCRKYPIARGHQATTETLYEELEWYAAGGEPPRLLGLVLRDRVDGDYSWVVFTRGANLQYRAIALAASIFTQESAVNALRVAMERWLAEPDAVLAHACGA